MEFGFERNAWRNVNLDWFHPVDFLSGQTTYTTNNKVPFTNKQKINVYAQYETVWAFCGLSRFAWFPRYSLLTDKQLYELANIAHS